jgi:hypothetical protein
VLESATFRVEGWRRPVIITYSVITQLRRVLFVGLVRSNCVRAGVYEVDRGANVRELRSSLDDRFVVFGERPGEMDTVRLRGPQVCFVCSLSEFLDAWTDITVPLNAFFNLTLSYVPGLFLVGAGCSQCHANVVKGVAEGTLSVYKDAPCLRFQAVMKRQTSDAGSQRGPPIAAMRMNKSLASHERRVITL